MCDNKKSIVGDDWQVLEIEEYNNRKEGLKDKQAEIKDAEWYKSKEKAGETLAC